MSNSQSELSERQLLEYFEACATGDAQRLRKLLAEHPRLVHVRSPIGGHYDRTGLHAAAASGHIDAVRVLLEHGADPNAREAGDNTYALHWAAAAGHLEVARALIEAGGDVHGTGDVHELDVIGWATVFSESPNRAPTLTLLLQNGARHHIFSAIALGDLDLIRQVIADDPKALHRRLSRYEQGQTPVHFAITRKRYDILDVLIALGADLEAPDWNGQTALAVAIMRHDREAIERLTAAGARQPSPIAASEYKSRIAKAAGSTRKGAPMINVPDVAAALDWYTSIGFTEVGRYADDGVVNWGMVSFGNAELMLSMHGKSGQHDASLWFYIDDAEELYKLLKSRQLEAAQASLAGKKDVPGQIEFAQELYDPPYGGREFGILDLNGYDLRFLQERS